MQLTFSGPKQHKWNVKKQTVLRRLGGVCKVFIRFKFNYAIESKEEFIKRRLQAVIAKELHNVSSWSVMLNVAVLKTWGHLSTFYELWMRKYQCPLERRWAVLRVMNSSQTSRLVETLGAVRTKARACVDKKRVDNTCFREAFSFDEPFDAFASKCALCSVEPKRL